MLREQIQAVNYTFHSFKHSLWNPQKMVIFELLSSALAFSTYAVIILQFYCLVLLLS